MRRRQQPPVLVVSTKSDLAAPPAGLPATSAVTGAGLDALRSSPADGRELYKRLSDMGSHWVKLGRSLDRAVESYNAAVGSLESRVLVSARRFVELETTPFGVDIEELSPVDKTARALQGPGLFDVASDKPS